MKFRPDIEGLRALAIIPVVVFHAFPAALPGGYIGVDVFFVISGFLITSLLMQRLASNQYSIASFYGARVRRIFPAVFSMLVLLLPAALWFLPPASVAEFGRMLGATSLFVSNMELYRTTDYFDGATELKPLVHTWSLAVEEQYYILFPIMLALFYRYRRTAITSALLAVGVGSLAASVWMLRNDPPLAFYSAVSRTFELMIGSLFAVSMQQSIAPRWLRELAAGVGLVAIIGACIAFRPEMPFPGVAALLPCGGAAAIIWAGSQGETWVGRGIAMPPLRWIGAMSFSLYLWHWPILVFTRHALLGTPNVLQATAAVLVSVLFAWASLRWVETPVRRARATDKRLLLAASACIALMLMAAWAAIGYAARQEQRPTPFNVLLAGSHDISPQRAQCHSRGSRVIPYRDRCIFGDASSRRHIAVWADSHGVELALALGERLKPNGYAVAQITSSSCPPAPGFAVATRRQCLPHNDATLRELTADPNLISVVMIARYKYYLHMDARTFEASLLRAVNALTAAGKRVVLVDPFPVYTYPVPVALAMTSRRGSDTAVLEQPLIEYQNANREALSVLERLAARPGVTRVFTEGALCGTGRCVLLEGNKPVYFDDNHLSMTGARRLAASIEQSLPASH